MATEKNNEITRVITAAEAVKKTENSRGALTVYLKNITDKIIAECEKGKREAWVVIPSNSLEEEIKDELRLAGYVVRNRQASNVLIEW